MWTDLRCDLQDRGISFDEVDLNGDGVIDQDEFYKVCLSTSYELLSSAFISCVLFIFVDIDDQATDLLHL